MKNKQSSFLLLITLLIICGIASYLLWHGHQNFDYEQGTVSRVHHHHHKKKKTHPVTWGYPFKRLYEKKIKFKSGQKYGQTDILRRTKPKSYFHDGYDFGFSEVGHSPVLAVHTGTVHRVHYRTGMGLYVWVISPDGYVEIYQEGFLSITDIYVKKGQKVKLGQKIGRLTGSHIHLGITKTDKDYIDKHGDPCGNWWKDNGTWLNPMKIINDNLKGTPQEVQ
ncbi:M23 family metallopeptidase [Lactobacillus xujianguonis]|uniref:M23 family metallopeptidase n=1 Tax=Lactobacillus xujianguonis TaxID=2495899 RepID=A0A437SY17_9LACO|nr:M23 family metallopeptidase [Lactobacillus xujianguonis]RVU71707.1 M23 family metallopeptidase [Lactobacillus xujianguonis]